MPTIVARHETTEIVVSASLIEEVRDVQSGWADTPLGSEIGICESKHADDGCIQALQDNLVVPWPFAARDEGVRTMIDHVANPLPAVMEGMPFLVRPVRVSPGGRGNPLHEPPSAQNLY